jgi:hypothetical protein
MVNLPLVALASAVSAAVALIAVGYFQSKSRRAFALFLAAAAVVIVIYIILRWNGIFAVSPQLGATEDAQILVDITAGVIVGIVFSALISAETLRQVRWSSVVIPLLVSPLFVAPVWKIYIDQNIAVPEFHHYVTFFLSGLTSGFAWKSAVDKLKEVS